LKNEYEIFHSGLHLLQGGYLNVCLFSYGTSRLLHQTAESCLLFLLSHLKKTATSSTFLNRLIIPGFLSLLVFRQKATHCRCLLWVGSWA